MKQNKRNRYIWCILLNSMGILLLIIIERTKFLNISDDTLKFFGIFLVAFGIYRLGGIRNLLDPFAALLWGNGILIFAITNKWPSKFDIFFIVFFVIFIFIRIKFPYSESEAGESTYTTSWPYSRNSGDSARKKNINEAE